MIDTRQFRNFEDVVREDLKDPVEVETYLEVALELYEEDGDTEAFLLALQDVAEAQGGLDRLAKRTKLNGQNLSTLFSSKGNPRIDTIGTVLHGLGFKLTVQPLEHVKAHTHRGPQ